MSSKPGSKPLRVAVVGGSMGGLTTALLLRDLGHEVDVFERATGELTGFGAGIVAHEVSTRYFVQRTPDWLAQTTVHVPSHRMLDGSGALLWDYPVAYRFVSWGGLYRALLGAFGRERYHQGAALVGFDQDAAGVDLRFASGRESRYDLLVLADGLLSTGRQRLFPGVEPVYSGYVAWRGTVAEGDIPARILQQLDDTITYVLVPNSHILVYPIPGNDNRVDRGHRSWNFVWYRNVAKGAALEELLTDRDGYPHSASLRPGRVQDRYVHELKEHASAALPQDVAAIVNATEQPFIQAVMDVESPELAVGRVCILGDAAFVARPHAAAGTAKAAENAWTLAAAIATVEDDLPDALQRWSAHQTALGSSLVARSRHMGEGSQFRCDWRPGDPALRFGLYESGDSCTWTRAAHSAAATRREEGGARSE
ncbi:MAG: NAD(P)-binding protein [Betaproteobacteria bacterium]|nr:MAG: NAD(P)-binding protein [Betaproteobacteria bacterium]